MDQQAFPIAPTVAEALDCFKGGFVARAEELYRQVLDAEPDNPDALHMLGIITDTGGHPQTAAELIGRALALTETASMRSNFGMVLCHLGRHEEALAEFERALALRPAYPEALSNLGVALEALDRNEEAAAAYRRAVALKPDYADAWSNLGNALKALDRHQDAVDAFELAVGLNPQAPLEGLASSLRALDKLEAAVEVYHRIIDRNPKDYRALIGLSNSLRDLNRLVDAEAACRKALALHPATAWPYNILSINLAEQGRHREALTVLDLALTLAPEDAETRHHRAMLLFQLGRMTEGWVEYHWRFKTKQAGDAMKPLLGREPWRGEPLDGKTILLIPEQGLGDMVQFMRYVPMVAARGGRVILMLQRPVAQLAAGLRGLAAGPGAVEIVAAGDPVPPYNLHCPMLSLPIAFGTTETTIPAEVPYLSAEPERTARWQARFAAEPGGLKVGIVWAGNPNHLNDRRRSIPFAALAPLWSVPGVRWFSLQVGARVEDLRAAAPDGVTDLSPELEALADTAAAIANLDLVIVPDTLLAHLSGALGKPVWMMLSTASDWRWPLAGPRTPWYPTMRLFRQTEVGAWAPVVARVVEALQAKTTSMHRPVGSERSDHVVFDWGVSSYFGWGVQGLHMLLGWAGRSDLLPVTLQPIDPAQIDVDPLERALLEPALRRSREVQAQLASVRGQRATTSSLVLHAIHNGLVRSRQPHELDLFGSPTVAIAVFDQTDPETAAVERLRHYPLVLTSSRWNRDLLRQAGLTQVDVLPEGVDRSYFHPAPRRDLFAGKFVVFSGGELEYRKGQDLVLRAFRRFARRHADALLLTAWASPWPHFARSLALLPDIAPPVFGPDGQIDAGAWAAANDLPAHQIQALGAVPNRAVARIVREADVALFPNRGEGGTNLVAMECMACGVPVILSANTGHLDLIEGDNAFVLDRQAAIPGDNHLGWGESDVDEMVETLECVYADRTEAQRRGSNAAVFMADRSWQHRMDRLGALLTALKAR